MIEIVLRHHFEPADPRLGRHIAHDVRSKNFPAETATVHSLEWPRHVPIFDQGNLGSCTGNAAAGCMSTGPFTHRLTEANAVSIYSQATHLDSIRGVYPPNDTGSSGLAVMKACKLRGWITAYGHAFGLSHAIGALMLGPGIVGMAWLTGCDSPNAEGIVRYEGTVRGGHEIELVGYDATRGLVKFANSWGAGWGKGGYFYMSTEDFGKALSEGGDATFPAVPAAA
jgi:hypothetical protein